MERKTAGLLGALAGVAALGGASAQAATHVAAPPPEPLAVTSYADLLRPIPNAVEALKASNAALVEQARNAPAKLEQADWGEMTITITIIITTTTITTITTIITNITRRPRRQSMYYPPSPPSSSPPCRRGDLGAEYRRDD